MRSGAQLGVRRKAAGLWFGVRCTTPLMPVNAEQCKSPTTLLWQPFRALHPQQLQAVKSSMLASADPGARRRDIHHQLGQVLAGRAGLLLLGRHEPHAARDLAAALRRLDRRRPGAPGALLVPLPHGARPPLATGPGNQCRDPDLCDGVHGEVAASLRPWPFANVLHAAPPASPACMPETGNRLLPCTQARSVHDRCTFQ